MPKSTRVCLAGHPFHLFRPLWRRALFEYAPPLDIETDIPFCCSIPLVVAMVAAAAAAVLVVVVVVLAVVHEPSPFPPCALRSSSATTISTSTSTSSGGFAGCAFVAAPFARLFRQCAVRRRSGNTCFCGVSWCVARGGCRGPHRAACKRSSDNNR